MEHLEGLLTRKALTARDMRDLLPTVWWPGAATQAASDPRVSEPGYAAGIAVQAGCHRRGHM